MKYLSEIVLVLCLINVNAFASPYDNDGAFDFEVTHIRGNDTLHYDLKLVSDNNDNTSNNSWTWELNFNGKVDGKQMMINKTVSFNPILDIYSAFPISENSKVDLSGFEAFQVSFPPLVGIVDLDKKILEPKVVLPFFNNTINAKILNNPKEKKVKQTIITTSGNDSIPPTYKSETNQLAIDKTEIAYCTYSTGGKASFSTNDVELEVSRISCVCEELGDSNEINKAIYYYNPKYGIVYFKIELEKELIEIKLRL